MIVMTNPKLRYKNLWIFIGYTLIGCVIYLSVTSEPIDPGIDVPFIDKLYHALAYLTLMLWFSQIYHINKQKYLWAVFFIALGILMEYIQSFDPKRQYELADMIANSTGVVAGILLTKTALRNTLLRLENLF